MIVLLFLIPVLFFAAVYYVYRLAFHSPNQTQNDDFHLSDSEQMVPFRGESLAMIKDVRSIPYEKVSIRSVDGLTLNGRLYRYKGTTTTERPTDPAVSPTPVQPPAIGQPAAWQPAAWREYDLSCPFAEEARPLAILFHGWRGTPARDFSGGAKLMMEAGFDVLAIEERACVTSEGHVITFGVKEREDMLEWIRFGEEKLGAKRILPVGISMGAATVLMNADKVPQSVFALVADCPYTTPLAIIEKVGRQMHVPAKVTRFLAILAARWLGHFDLTDPQADAVKAVKASSLPILLIHGEADDFVPCEMSKEIAEANPAWVEFHTFPNAGHGMSYLLDKDRYKKTTLLFIQKHWKS